MVFNSAELRGLTPLHLRYGWDIIARIGVLRWLKHQQLSEIQDELSYAYSLHIPQRTIDCIAQRFLLYHTAVHIESAPALMDSIRKQGIFVLHVDSTQQDGSHPLAVHKEGMPSFRVWAEKLFSERKEDWEASLKNVRAHFGNPDVVVRDMGKGVTAGVQEVFPDSRVIISHYHFIRDVGYRLFNPLYPGFKKRIDRTDVKGRLRAILRVVKKRLECASRCSEAEEKRAYELLEWVLSYEKDGEGLGYPFEMLHLMCS